MRSGREHWAWMVVVVRSDREHCGSRVAVEQEDEEDNERRRTTRGGGEERRRRRTRQLT